MSEPKVDTKFKWYEIITSDISIQQGDFIDSCPVVVPTNIFEPGVKVNAEVKEYDVVIMSQSCDIAANKIDIVLVCPVWTLEQLAKQNNYFNNATGKENLRRGNNPGYHLLNKCELIGFESDYKVVDYRSIFGIDIEQIKMISKTKKTRLRLLPPYREHLSQAFARFFMRVGLPVDIPEFK